MTSRTFPKNEHLKSKKQIEALFHQGKAFSVFPLKIYYLPTHIASPGIACAGFAVPSRVFKKAVERNRIKRQMREAYRLQKNELTTFLHENGFELALFFIFVDKKLPQYADLHKKTGKALKKLIDKLQTQANEDT